MMGSLMAASQPAAEHGIAGHQRKAAESESEQRENKHGNLLSDDGRISRCASVFDMDLPEHA
jgi:hypothetical protein